MLQRTVTQFEPMNLQALKYKEQMPAIPEHFGDELSPSNKNRESKQNSEPIFEIGKLRFTNVAIPNTLS